MIAQDTVKSVVNTIARQFHPQKIVLFGSVATGQQASGSDLDLLIVMETDMPRWKRSVPIHMAFKPYPCAMDILVYTPEEIEKYNGITNHIVTEALATGTTVYEEDDKH